MVGFRQSGSTGVQPGLQAQRNRQTDVGSDNWLLSDPTFEFSIQQQQVQGFNNSGRLSLLRRRPFFSLLTSILAFLTNLRVTVLGHHFFFGHLASSGTSSSSSSTSSFSLSGYWNLDLRSALNPLSTRRCFIHYHHHSSYQLASSGIDIVTSFSIVIFFNSSSNLHLFFFNCLPFLSTPLFWTSSLFQASDLLTSLFLTGLFFLNL